jgi:predicted Fe-Mo cluster-binding NifX family protein
MLQRCNVPTVAKAEKSGISRNCVSDDTARLSLLCCYMETIAVTEWNGVVSPLFDTACTWLVMRPEGSSTAHNVRNLSLGGKSDLCVNESVTVMICGAITAHARSLLEERGIRVVSWVCGAVDQVVATFRNGEDLSVRFAMPGCRQAGCRGGKGRGGHRRRQGTGWKQNGGAV